MNQNMHVLSDFEDFLKKSNEFSSLKIPFHCKWVKSFAAMGYSLHIAPPEENLYHFACSLKKMNCQDQQIKQALNSINLFFNQFYKQQKYSPIKNTRAQQIIENASLTKYYNPIITKQADDWETAINEFKLICPLLDFPGVEKTIFAIPYLETFKNIFYIHRPHQITNEELEIFFNEHLRSIKIRQYRHIKLSFALFFICVVRKKHTFFNDCTKLNKALKLDKIVIPNNDLANIIKDAFGVNKLNIELSVFAGIELKDSLNIKMKHLNLDKNKISIHNSKYGRDRIVFIPSHLNSSLKVYTHSKKIQFFEDIKKWSQHENIYPIKHTNQLWGEVKLFSRKKFEIKDDQPFYRSKDITSFQKALKKAAKKNGYNSNCAYGNMQSTYVNRVLEHEIKLSNLAESLGLKKASSLIKYLPYIYNNI